jgi:hypothetical protein
MNGLLLLLQVSLSYIGESYEVLMKHQNIKTSTYTSSSLSKSHWKFNMLQQLWIYRAHPANLQIRPGAKGVRFQFMNKFLHEMIFSSGEELKDEISTWPQTQSTYFSKCIKL